jgi:hypothetical protein
LNDANIYLTDSKENKKKESEKNFEGIHYFDDKVLKIFPLWIDE